MLLKMTDGIAHYNGNNVEYLINFYKNRTQIFGEPLFFENEVFVLGYESSTNSNLVYHWKLEKKLFEGATRHFILNPKKVTELNKNF